MFPDMVFELPKGTVNAPELNVVVLVYVVDALTVAVNGTPTLIVAGTDSE
jgi:hypothetical protein